jgi:hypothetical protein
MRGGCYREKSTFFGHVPMEAIFPATSIVCMLNHIYFVLQNMFRLPAWLLHFDPVSVFEQPVMSRWKWRLVTLSSQSEKKISACVDASHPSSQIFLLLTIAFHHDKCSLRAHYIVVQSSPPNTPLCINTLAPCSWALFKYCTMVCYGRMWVNISR